MIGGGLALSVLLLSACAGNDTAPQEEVDLDEAMDLFDATEPDAPAQQPDMDAVIARVEGTEITQQELLDEMSMLMGQMQGQIPPDQMEQVQGQLAQGALENLITKQLVANEVEREGIVVDDTEVEGTIAMIRQQIPEGASLDQQLAQMGMTETELRENIRHDMAMNKLLEERVGEGQPPTPEEVDAFYEEHKEEYFAMPESVEARHILVQVDAEADEEERAAARAKADEIHQQLAEGADFAAVAEMESDCPSGQQGGHLGSFGRGQMVPAFEEAAFAQEIDEIGDVVESDFGYHVILVDSRTEGRTQPLEEVSEQIAEFLGSQDREGKMHEYVEGLREEADIEFVE